MSAVSNITLAAGSNWTLIAQGIKSLRIFSPAPAFELYVGPNVPDPTATSGVEVRVNDEDLVIETALTDKVYGRPLGRVAGFPCNIGVLKTAVGNQDAARSWLTLTPDDTLNLTQLVDSNNNPIELKSLWVNGPCTLDLEGADGHVESLVVDYAGPLPFYPVKIKQTSVLSSAGIIKGLFG